MNLVLRSIRRKSKRATKYSFSISPKELAIEHIDTNHEPMRVIVALMHRQRRYECKPRVTEPSFSDARRRLVQWPDAAADFMTFTITLFRDDKKEIFDDKEWTLVVESLDANERAHPVAAVTLNLRLFVGASVEAKLRLRPLRPEVSQCMMILNCGSIASPSSARESITSTDAVAAAVAELDAVKDRERASICVSHLPIEANGGKDIASTSYVDENLTNSRPKISTPFEDIAATAEVSVQRKQSAKAPPSISASPSAAPTRPNGMTTTTITSSTKTTTTTLVSPTLEEERRERTLSVKAEPHSVSLVMEELERLKSQKEEDKMADYQAQLEDEERAKSEESARKEQLRDEARRLMREAMSATTAQRSFMLRSTHSAMDGGGGSSNGLMTGSVLRSSQNDLRTLDFVTPQFNFRQFSKRQPSPFLQRKAYESPLLPSFRITRGVHNSATDNSADDENDSTELPNVLNRSDEEENVVERNENVRENATRKITSNFEKEIHQPASKIQIEVEKIAERVSEVEKLDSYVEQKMRNTEAGSEDEQKYINQHLKLLTEKDSLVRRQDYLNVLIDLKETVAKIEELQRLVNQITTDELLHTNKTAELMIELKNLIDKKDELSHTLIDKEAEEEEENERGKRLLQQSQNFVRGVEEPLSASKRIFNWFNSPRTTTTN